MADETTPMRCQRGLASPNPKVWCRGEAAHCVTSHGEQYWLCACFHMTALMQLGQQQEEIDRLRARVAALEAAGDALDDCDCCWSREPKGDRCTASDHWWEVRNG